jgi:hypothetical protein
VRAAEFGTYPRASAALSTRAFVLALMLVPAVLFKTKETVVCDTPAARAMSQLVTRRVIVVSY